MKLNCRACIAALFFTAALFPRMAFAQAPIPAPTQPAKAPQALIWMRWEMVEMPVTEWEKFAPKRDKAEPIPSLLTEAEMKALTAAIHKGHYCTVTGPMVSTMEGVEGTVAAQRKMFYGSADKGAFLTLGASATALPRLNPDGTVTFHFAFEETELTGTPAQGDAAPPTATVAMTTIRTAKPGQTLLLGGFSQTTVGSKLVRLLLVTTDVVTLRGLHSGTDDIRVR